MSLLDVQKASLLADFKKYDSRRRHLIVDDTTDIIIKKLFPDNILDEVYTCSKIDGENRSKDRGYALYLLDPNRIYSLNCFMADFSNGQRYRDAIVMFLPGNWLPFWENMIKNPNFSRCLNQSKDPIIVSYLTFIPLEPRLYVTGNNYSIPAYYNPAKHGNNVKRFQIDMAINSMLAVCIINKELPTIRYFNSPVAKELAFQFQQKLDDFYRNNSDIIPCSTRTIFLITDRTMDMFGPMCHYQYYRSQVYDLVDEMIIDRDIDLNARYPYTIETGAGLEKKVLKFDLDDYVYMGIKDMNFTDARNDIHKLYKELINEDERFKMSTDNLDVNVLRNALINQDDHARNKTLITGHNKFCSNLQKALQEKHIGDLITFENHCAAGLGPYDHLKTKVTYGLLNLLKTENIDDYNKIRLLITYALYRNGIIKADLVKLLHFCMPDKVDRILKLFENLQRFGVFLIKPNLKDAVPKNNTYFGVNESGNEFTMYVPTYSNIVKRLVNENLSEYYNTLTVDKAGYQGSPAGNDDDDDDDGSLKTFPYVKAPTPKMENDIDNAFGRSSSSRVRPKWTNVASSVNDVKRERLFIFCAGGLTPSEISCISSMENELNRNIIIGTDEIYSVLDMLGDINMIDDDFNFPLREKLQKRTVPEYVVKNSIDPTISSSPQPQQLQPGTSKLHMPPKVQDSAKAPEPVKKKGMKGMFSKMKNLNI